MSLVGRLKPDGTNAVSAYIYNSQGELSDGPRDLAVSPAALPLVSVAIDNISHRALVVWQTTAKVSGVVFDLTDYSKVKSLTIRTVAATNPTEVGVAHSPVENGFRVAWAYGNDIDTRLVGTDGKLGAITNLRDGDDTAEHIKLVHVPSNNSFTALFWAAGTTLHTKNSLSAPADDDWDLGVAAEGSMGTIAADAGNNGADDYSSVVLFSEALVLTAIYLDELGVDVSTLLPIGVSTNYPPAFANETKNGHPVYFNSRDINPRQHYFGYLPYGEEFFDIAEPTGSPLTNAYYGYAVAYSTDCDRYFGTATDGDFLDVTTAGPTICPASVQYQPGMMDFGVGAPSQQSFDLNITGAPVVVSSVEITGPGRHAYKIDNPTACKRHIQQNSQCRIMVSHVADSKNQQAALKVVSDSFINPVVMIPLTDNGSSQSGGFISLIAPASASIEVNPADATLVWQGISASTPVQYRVSACTDPGLTSCIQTSSVITGR